MTNPSKFKAFLASVRSPNLPSVACNVFSGIAFAAITAPINSWNAAAAITSGICLYLAGNLLNDWHDRKWDAVHRPERALPQGIFQASSYLVLAITLCSAALLTSAVNLRSLFTAIAIIGLILIYTKIHKAQKFAVIPMGLCRALLPILGYFACVAPSSTSSHLPKALTLFAIGLFAHVCGLSLIARKESKTHSSLIPTLTLITVAAYSSNNLGFNQTWAATLPYMIWSLLAVFLVKKSLNTCVSMLLAGIPLLDWIFLIPLAPQADPPLATIILLAPPVACFLGKSLQKIVPAT